MRRLGVLVAAIALAVVLFGCGSQTVLSLPSITHTAPGRFGGPPPGSPVAGDILYTNSGHWSGSPTGFTYQWDDCNGSGASCTAAAGSPNNTTRYVIVSGDVGFTIRVAVTATYSGGQTATVMSQPTSVVSTTSMFPLQVSGNSRYLETASGTPWLMVGDSPWTIVGNADASHASTYFADRESNGFTAILMSALCDAYISCATGSDDSEDFAGNKPFTVGTGIETYNLSDQNSTYWSNLHTIVADAEADNLAVLLVPIDIGGCGAQGGSWADALTNNGDGTISTTDNDYKYGQFLGTEFSDLSNVVWEDGNDLQCIENSTYTNDLQSVMNGIHNTDSSSLQTVETDFNATTGWGGNSGSCTGSIENGYSTSLQDTECAATPFTSGSVNFNWVYTYAPAYVGVEKAYTESPTMPAVMGESNYEGQKNGATVDGCQTVRNCRLQEWWTATSGSTGQVYGGPSFPFSNSLTSADYDSTGQAQLGAMATFLNTIDWWTLAPSSALITSGGGSCPTTGSIAAVTCVTAASDDPGTSSNTEALLYLPDPSSFSSVTVDMSKFTGSINAEWVDPADGATTSIGSFSNSGTHTFTPSTNNSAGDKDWVLYLKDPPAPATAYTVPSSRTVTFNPGLTPIGGVPDAGWSVSTTLSPSGSDDTTAINNALSSCPNDGVVKLNPGVFTISGPLLMENSNCVLRGSGPGPGNFSQDTAATGTAGTYIEMSQSAGGMGAMLTVGPEFGDEGTPTNLTADGVRGQNSVTVASTSGLSVGELAVVSMVTGNTTVAAGSNGVNVNTFTGSGTLNVASTTDFPSSGSTLIVPTSGGDASLTYTGTTSTTFTGVTFTSGDAGTLATGGEVLDSSLAHWNSQEPENDSGWFEFANRPLGDTEEITAISGNTVTFSSDLSMNYPTSQAATLTPLPSGVNESGVEDVYFYDGAVNNVTSGIHLINCDHCWVDHVEMSDTSQAVNFEYDFGNQLTDSYIHDAPGGLHADSGSYGVVESFYATNTLVQNNIVINFNKVNVMRSAGAGNVWGYNYMDNGQDLAGDWTEDTLEGNHMATPHFELFEGNEAPNGDTSGTWGNNIDTTYFRNYLTGEDRDYPGIAPVRAAGEDQWDLNTSFIGNVLGEPADSHYSGYEAIVQVPSWTGYLWQVCEPGDNVPDNNECADTVLRDGNYDYVSGEVHWHGVGGTGVGSGLTPPTDDTLPNSLYLTGKPAFFGSNTWPWVDGSSASNPLPGDLPAKERFDAGTPNTL